MHATAWTLQNLMLADGAADISKEGPTARVSIASILADFWKHRVGQRKVFLRGWKVPHCAEAGPVQ